MDKDKIDPLGLKAAQRRRDAMVDGDPVEKAPEPAKPAAPKPEPAKPAKKRSLLDWLRAKSNEDGDAYAAAWKEGDQA